jgi:hypothetical protein
MKFWNSKTTPTMEITLPSGMKIVAQLSGNADPNRPEADWAGINVVMVAPTGNRFPLCSAEYVERDRMRMRMRGATSSPTSGNSICGCAGISPA